jgi:hypothetical protein
MKTTRDISIAIIVIATLVLAASASCQGRDTLSIGTFLVLAITLVALIVYAHDTNLIANIQKQQAEMNQPVFMAGYLMHITGTKGDSGRTVFQLHNPSTLPLRAKIWCNFQIYGQRVDSSDDFNGRKVWRLFPQQMSQGWFELASLLSRRGKTIADMLKEATDANRDYQLTMDLEIEYRDELGGQRRLPPRRHYFDFPDWTWIPVLTGAENWEEK